MLKAFYKKYTLNFRQPSGTSRGILTQKDSWFIFIYDEKAPQTKGVGECSPLKGLSIDDRPDYEQKLNEVCETINDFQNHPDKGMNEFPSIRFGLETALLDFKQKGTKILFESDFTAGKDSIPINGLVWMGSFEEMKKQIQDKIKAGFHCIKLKIGAINFSDELSLLKLIRKEYGEPDLEIRVDANGAFKPEDALEKLKRLSEYRIHSIEQPIRQGQWEQMAGLCRLTPIPIGLDEELIGVSNITKKKELLNTILPQYIILKPSLLGGFLASKEWIDLADAMQTGWWVTSALESNIGLNAIAQWTYTLDNPLPQGLGTGQLYSNNFDSPLFVSEGKLKFNPEKRWDIKPLRS